jgi:fibronectin type 3 domain-containing protein
LLTITTIAQEVPTRPTPPTMSAPAIEQQSPPSAAPKEQKVHWAALKWTASPTKGIEGYYVYRAVAGLGGKPQRITAHPVKGTIYRDMKVKPGTTYIYSLTTVQRINSRWVESNRTPLVTARIPTP